jgi:molybdate/tungstate transport system substrate-binding protein
MVALALVLPVACGGGDHAAVPTTTPSVDPNAVVIGHAGSLNALVQDKLSAAMAAQGITIRSDPGASPAVAQKIKDGTPTDLYATADANTNDVLMGAANGNRIRWFATFASNAVVVAYSPLSPKLADFQKAKAGTTAWYAPLERKGVRVTRSDPDTDPGGYYTVMVAQLAGLDAKDKGLKKRILGDDRNPEQVRPGATAQLKDGQIDASFMYRTMALSAGLPFVELPKRINLSDRDQAKSYARATFMTKAGTTYTGAVIAYSIAPIEQAAHSAQALRIIEFLLSAAGQKLIRSLGFLSIPVLIGGDRSAVPASLSKYADGDWPR